MRKLVSLYYNSGQSRKSFANSHGVTESKLYYWIKKFSKEQNQVPSLETSSSFIPLEVSDSKDFSERTILIRMPNGLEIQIPI